MDRLWIELCLESPKILPCVVYSFVCLISSIIG